MKTLSRILAAGFLAVAAFLPFAAPQPALADARIVVCAPTASGRAEGPRRIVNPNTTTAYVLNSQGCAAVSSADYGWFLSQGFTPGANLFSVSKTGITAQDFTSLVLPVGAYLQGVVIRNTTTTSVTQIKLGLTAGGSEVSSGIACGASCLAYSTDVSLNKRVFSATASTQISVDATAWNGASVDVTLLYSLF